jgi:cell division protein FtsB
VKNPARKRSRKEKGRRVQWVFSLHLNKWFLIMWPLLVIAFVIWAWFGENGFRTAWKLRAQRQALELENGMLQSSNERLKEEIDLIQNDPLFLEWIVRDRLGMIGENERLYVFRE